MPEHKAAVRKLGPSPVHRMSFPVMHELQGEFSEAFYALKSQLFAAIDRDGMGAFEAALKAQACALAEPECKKLRLLAAKRWKSVA